MPVDGPTSPDLGIFTTIRRAAGCESAAGDGVTGGEIFGDSGGVFVFETVLIGDIAFGGLDFLTGPGPFSEEDGIRIGEHALLVGA